ncbi:MAG: aldehyde dehydrogenase family protein [Candidatus Hydrogenedentes bacterium]|nr:aldehyde dehydrogenase family protein [Candidatus Hydrogenedentota bacterium]
MSSTHELKIINPATEDVAFTLPLLQENAVDGLVEQARNAYGAWRFVPVAERIDLVRKAMEQFRAKGETIATDITRQMGKPLTQARRELTTMLDRAEHMAGIAEHTLADEFAPAQKGFSKYIRHEPLGVVLDIAAWNYPLLIAVNVVVPAVLAGNAVIIKHSNRTPLCGAAFTDAFTAAGAPDGLVQHIVANHAVTEKFIRHGGVNYVSFTGSTGGGREINRNAADRFINVGLELGGKDPAYVCADAPFDFAVDNCVDGAFYNAGQSCCAIERVYVDRAIYDDFVEAYAARTREYRLGDPMDDATSIGPLASKGAREFLEDQVKDAVAKGGRLVVDPAEFDAPGKGWYAAPAVVADAPQDCGLMQEESFGPVIGIRAVDSADEALSLMNDSPYGLTASIWTQDPERARWMGERVETGTFFMNRCDYVDPALAWTGVKDTGRGCTLSPLGLLQLTQPKSMHLRTALPE